MVGHAQGLQSTFSGGVISRQLQNRVDIERFYSSFRSSVNFVVRAEGFVFNRQGTTFIAEVANSSSSTRLIDFSFSDSDDEQQYLLEFSGQRVRFIRSTGVVQASGGGDYEITLPYQQQDLFKLRYAQSADELFIASTRFQQAKLVRLADNDWTYELISAASSLNPPTGGNGVWSGGLSDGTFTEFYRLTSVTPDGEESAPTERFEVQRNQVWSDGETITLSWNALTGAGRYYVYKEIAGVYGYIGQALGESFRDTNYLPDASIVPPVTKNPFSNSNWPTAVTFFEERLTFGGLGTKPFELNFSRTNLFSNFNQSEPTRADDAIQVSLLGGRSGQVNAIKHLVELDQLVVFTNNVIFGVMGVDGGPITPDSVERSARAYISAGDVAPIPTEDSVLVVDRTGKRVTDVRPGTDLRSTEQADLSALVRSLFEERVQDDGTVLNDRHIVDWAQAKDPDDIIWCVMSDGSLLGLTYVREQDVWAWHEHSTPNGHFESVGVLEVDGTSVPHFVVRRQINGLTKRYIEALQPRVDSSIEDAFFVDSGLTYTGASTSTISGLEHLEGETVAILADGFVLEPQTVSGGSVTLPIEATTVHVGLMPSYEFETLNVAAQARRGNLQIKEKAITGVDIIFDRTAETSIGPTKELARDVRWRTTEKWDTPADLFSGTREVNIFSSWDKDPRVFVHHKNPTPITILGIAPSVSYED
ncbi:MAG: hypothetical protein AAF225_10145 [Pseudomonadota bacterium]